jgi:hypothetical protein
LERFGISMAIILASLAYAHFKPLQKLRFVLLWLSHGIGIVNELVDWLLVPIRGIFKLIGMIFRKSENAQAS